MVNVEHTDGRNIDPSLGTLSGEGASIAVHEPRDVYPTRVGAPPGELTTEVGYYGLPALKEPVWISTIPTYFYVGGVAGASLALAAAVELAPHDEAMRVLSRRCRVVALVGIVASSGLLVADLGRPERFLHMLRVFRPTSPMSVGSWVLVAAGGVTTLSFLPGIAGRACTMVGGLLGAPLAGYTAVLLANTAVPLWSATRRTLPILFVASAVTAAASLLELLPSSPREARVVRRFGLVGKLAELVATELVSRDASRVHRVGAPLRSGLAGSLFRSAKLLTLASAALSIIPRRGRATRAVSGVLGTLGAIAVRFAIFHAGKSSARDAQATFSAQRAG
jgi:formate-dependent nitrite reductase membrane component NrfD